MIIASWKDTDETAWKNSTSCSWVSNVFTLPTLTAEGALVKILLTSQTLDPILLTEISSSGKVINYVKAL